jgi:heme/copper-type cytochrome/quinol oxidase subunit 1
MHDRDPHGIQIFCWIATMWSGRVSVKAPMLWILGFFAIFVAGGLTGVMLRPSRSIPAARHLLCRSAHFHYVLIGGAVFRSSPVLLLVSKDHGTVCSASASAAGCSGSSSPAST